MWLKAKIVPGYNSALYRKDCCGRFIKKSDYGNIYSKYGWEVDHIRPVARGGSDHIDNLQALQWELNRSKGDTYPWACPLTVGGLLG